MIVWLPNCRQGKSIVVWILMVFVTGFANAQSSNFQLSGPLRGLYQGMEQGQQEALQAQQIEYQRQMVEQQRMQNEQMRRQQIQLQQQQQAEAARQQQLHQMQLENERLKRQLLEQQTSQVNKRGSAASLKSTTTTDSRTTNSVRTVDASVPRQNNSVLEGGACNSAQECVGKLLCTNKRCTSY